MVTRTKIESEDLKDFHFEVLPRATKNAFLHCSNMKFFSSGKWYLAGGTALALYAGHRKSVDLDFFTTESSFDEKRIEKELSLEGGWKTSSLDHGTVYGEFFGAKISLIAYPFFKPKEGFTKIGAVSILAPEDIAVMKTIAISQRGKKRDFFDLYWLCHNRENLSQTLERIDKQYNIHQNLTHLLKSLVYFTDADDDPMPDIFFKATWPEVKKFFQKEVPRITKKIIGLP